MDRDEVAQLMLDLERSVQMRQQLHARLARNEAVDLLEAWDELEQLDMEIARKIRKRRIE